MKIKIFKTLQEFIDYRNMIVSKAHRRTKVFGDNRHNYYWLRLKYIDTQYPEYSGLGVITFK